MYKYDYRNLRERMRELNVTQAGLAKSIGLSTRTFSLKMNGKRSWKQDEMYDMMRALGIPEGQAHEYFFALKVQK